MKKLFASGVFFALLCLFIIPPAQLRGQANASGSILGQVTDQSGGVVAGAEVTLTDTATKTYHTTPTNSAGRFVFTDVQPGFYDVKVQMKGFRQSSVTGQQVIVGQSLTINVTLEVGAATQTVEVKATPGAELQTLNATMGTTVTGDMLLNMPNINRDATSLLTFQPGTVPTAHVGDIYGGQVAGSMSDQNTYMLDGGNVTSDLEGDNNYTAGGMGAIPTPIESIQEFKVATNNQTADFASSAGGQVMMVTKRGTSSFHGAGYEFFQAQFLNANSWTNNFHHNPIVKFHDNRFGVGVGGPMLPGRILGGKTYFYAFYEGRRFPGTASFLEWTVPSALMRQGILQFNAGGTLQQFNLKTSTACGGGACDPRGIGISPVVAQMWNTFEPLPNDPSAGDTLNTQGYRAALALPEKENYGTGRIDHDFGDKWRAFVSYRIYKDTHPSTNQIDIGGLLPGDKLGVPAAVSNNPRDPRYSVFGLTGTITPSLTNEFHISYLRDDWQWVRAGVTNALANVPAGIEFADSAFACMCPVNMDTQDSRKRVWNGHDWTYNDTLNWIKGNHFTQFGGSFVHWWDHHVRDDQVVAGLPELVYQINKGTGLKTSAATRPVGLSSSDNSAWDSDYASVLGFIGTAAQLFVRGGNDFHLTGAKTFADTSIIDSYSLYFNDSWKVRPGLTINYGLEWGTQMPPYEVNGVQDFMVDSSGAIVTTQQYLDNTVSKALQGQVYNPVLGFEPIGAVGGHPKYPFQPFYGGFSPRIAIAWSPSFDSGALGKVFGNRKSVIRGGYARIYDRNNAVDLVLVPLLGYGFGQTIRCNGAGIIGGAAGCYGSSNTNPSNGFRLGVDGNAGPFPAVQQTLPIPAEPGINSPAGGNLSFLDNQWRPGSNDQIDFSIQRALADNMIVEVAYVGKWSKHLYQGIDLNNVPWMMTLGGQSFAKAFANLWQADATGKTSAGPQPFFEKALAGSSFCQGYASCSDAVLANEGNNGTGNISTENPYGVWSDLDTTWTAFGPALPNTLQGYNSMLGNATLGFSNYQAGIVSLQKRTGHGLMMNANLTWSHTLSTIGINQEYTQANPSVPFDLRQDYGPAPFDTRWIFNSLATYELPFGKGKRFAANNGVVDRIIGGWSFSPILTATSGLVQETYTGSCDEFGQGNVPFCSGMIGLGNVGNLSRTAHFGVLAAGNNIGRNGNASRGGAGVNEFADPVAAYNSFRPIVLGVDTRAWDEGPMYGQKRWNVDFSILKTTKITERVGTTFYAQFLNAFNHMEFNDPGQQGSAGLDLQNPHGFGVMSSQFNTPRQIELGLRVSF